MTDFSYMSDLIILVVVPNAHDPFSPCLSLHACH